jgi:uncharacterized membrane protein
VIAEHYARKWQTAGLIDAAAVERILAWEAGRRQPVWLWAVAGMGALAIALGVMAIVGANWDSIPDGVKLGGDLLVTGVCTIAVFLTWRRVQVWRRELAAFLLFGLVLAGIALIGQVYQLQSAPWHALVLWLALCTPFLALATFTRFNGAIWTIAVATTWFMLDDPLYAAMARLHAMPPGHPRWDSGHFISLQAYLAACGLIVVAALRDLWPPARRQADMILKLALAGLVVSCSLTAAFSLRSEETSPLWGAIAIVGLASALAGAVWWPLRTPAQRRLMVALLGASLAVWIAALLLDEGQLAGQDLYRALLFIVYWAAIGGLAARAGWRGWFGFAFTMVGLRLLVLYFEALGGLTATGFGLLGGGVLCIALAAIGWRLARRVSPTAARGGTL